MKTLKSFLIAALLFSSVQVFSQTGWFMTHDSITGYWVNSISIPSVNTGYISAHYLYHGSGIMYKTTNGGANWQANMMTPISVENVWFINENTGFFTGDNAYTSIIYKTTNGGTNWVRKDSLYSIFHLKFFDNNTGMAVGKYGTSMKTTNGGDNWSRLPNNTWTEPTSFVCLSADIWLVANDNIYKTTNGGQNWYILSFSSIGMYAYTFDFVNSTTGYNANYNGKVFKTTNAGENWTQVSSVNFIYSFFGNLDFLDENTGYLCSPNPGISVYKTTNGGANWKSSSSLPFTNFIKIQFINSNTGFAGDTDGRIYKTTNGGSVFVANISSEVPDKFELGQNYPNPFNQSTIFNLQCSRLGGSSTGLVKIIVYDATGREVQTLVNETLAPGTYQVRFDGSGLASGLYYYSMSIDGKQTAVKKMVMMK
ncbi:MAG: YCF48-related protein [Ignavibacteria bacterium]